MKLKGFVQFLYRFLANWLRLWRNLSLFYVFEWMLVLLRYILMPKS